MTPSQTESVTAMPRGSDHKPPQVQTTALFAPLAATQAATQAATRARTAGFTLTEMIVVILIILVISVAVLPSVMGSLKDRKFSEATRTLQAVIAGARDRAIQAGQPRGIRLIRDDADPWSVTRLVYIGVPEPYTVGRVTVTVVAGVATVTPDTTVYPDPHFEQVDLGKTSNAYDNVPRVFYATPPPLSFVPPRLVEPYSYIRFDRSGPAYAVISMPTGSPASFDIYPTPTNPTLTTGSHQYELYSPPSPLPQADAVLLPDGVVIDVRYSPILPPVGVLPPASPHPLASDLTVNIPRSRGIPNQYPPAAVSANPQTSWPTMDILFGPNGQVTGAAAEQPLIHFWIGEGGDKGPDPKASRGPDGAARTLDDLAPTQHHVMVTLNTRTGTVQTFQYPGTASGDVWPPPVAATPAYYSDIYAPAEQALGVSQLP